MGFTFFDPKVPVQFTESGLALARNSHIILTDNSNNGYLQRSESLHLYNWDYLGLNFMACPKDVLFQRKKHV